jgi:hypothetical protein
MATQPALTGVHVDRAESTLDGATVAFGASAAITIVFNALLTIVKDASEPLHDFMAKLTGHHWITHGVVVIAVFVILGLVLMRSDVVRRMSDTAVIASVVVAALANAGTIALWFLLF